MAQFLVIVESPAKCKTISKILGKEYKVMASYGHIRDLPKSKLGIDLDDFSVTYVPTDKKNVVDDIRKAANKSDIVFLCSDLDREGEFIAVSLIDMLGIKNKSKRATFNEITPKAVKEAIANPRDIDEKLVDSQQARRALDRIVGYKLSPLLWTKIRRGLSAGRVQSVAVRLIAEREREITAFNKDEYWTMDGDFNVGTSDVKASLKTVNNKKVVDDADGVDQAKAGKNLTWLKAKPEADALAGELRGKKYIVSKVAKSETTERPYPPFATSHLQMAAANRLGFDAKRTMNIAQGLYEGLPLGVDGHVGLITYMRTDSFNISKDASEAAKKFIVEKYGAKFYPPTANFYKSKAGSQGAHECIRPTRIDLEPDAIRTYMQPDQYRLYKLIWERFVASQMAPATYDTQTIEISAIGTTNDAVFRSSGRKAKFRGWTLAYGPDDDDQKGFPDGIIEGTNASLKDLTTEQHFTQPPPRYTDASLVKTMEKEGIGRPSTYASIIQVIQDRKYVEKTGKGGKAPFKATDLGLVVTDCLVAGFPSILDVGFTRDMEQDLDDIEEGKKTYKQVLKAFWSSFQKELKEAEKKMPSTKGGEKTDIKCPKCGKPLLKLLGSLGFFLKCEIETCKHTQDLDGNERMAVKPTGIKCDKCGAGVVKTSGRFGEYLCCEKYKEKKCDFTMALDKKGLPKRKIPPKITDIKCSKCNKGKMVIRVASRKKIPKPFLSCNAFPKCRNAQELPESLTSEGEEVMKIFSDIRMKDKADAATFYSDQS